MTFIAEAYLFHISLFDQLNGAFLNIDDGDQYHIPVGVVPTPGLEAQVLNDFANQLNQNKFSCLGQGNWNHGATAQVLQTLKIAMLSVHQCFR